MSSTGFFRTSAVLWSVWGAFHLFVGGFLLFLLSAGRVDEAMHGIAGQVELATLGIDYPFAVVATLKQHAFNLGWFGLVTLVASPGVWRGNLPAVALCAIVGGLGDVGYFVFIDLADLAVPPGPQMTWISGTAVVLSAVAWLRVRKPPTALD
ncbi:MAG: hypothetical protein ACR2QM_15390 [Longimicrobiales bacterium]